MIRKLCVVLCFLMSILLCGCSEEEIKEDEMYVYFINTEGNALITEIHPLMDVEETLNLLMKPAEKNVTVLGDVRIEKYEVMGNKLIVHFNNDYLELKKSIEVLFRASVVQTMTQFSEISFVMFYVGDKPLEDTDGNQIGLMRAEDFVSNVGYTSESYQTTNLKIYYASTDGKMLRQVKKNDVHYNINTSLEKLIVEQLMKGTNSENASNTIPKTTKLLGVSVKDGICYVNFDEKFATEGYDQNPEVTIYSIVNSIIENANVSKVQILIEGSSDVLYKGTVDLSRPLEWNASLLEE